MDNPALHLNQLNALRQLNPTNGVSVLKKLILIYLKSAPAFLSQIEDAIQGKDSLMLRRAAHTSKSSTANIAVQKHLLIFAGNWKIWETTNKSMKLLSYWLNSNMNFCR